MHFYRICLVILHICSALTYFPHLITHISRLPFRYLPLRLRIAYMTYWMNYCLVILGVLIWCLFVVCRQRTIWQIIRISAYVLIAKLIYTCFDVIVRILLNYTYFVITFDLLHIILLIPAIILTFLLVQHVKNNERKSHTLVHLDHSV